MLDSCIDWRGRLIHAKSIHIIEMFLSWCAFSLQKQLKLVYDPTLSLEEIVMKVNKEAYCIKREQDANVFLRNIRVSSTELIWQQPVKEQTGNKHIHRLQLI